MTATRDEEAAGSAGGINCPKLGRRTSHLQYGALPYRRRADASIEIMLITSRDTGRWLIPKGWPEPGLGGAEAAAREAHEEGGLVGRMADRAIGFYHYDKRLRDGSTVHCAVEVFALEVEQQLKSWPEQDERRIRWLDPEEAAEAVQEPELRVLIRAWAVAAGR
jgi:8-oxo-dGTP pyrophosphatase MutT (NUDIX family)